MFCDLRNPQRHFIFSVSGNLNHKKNYLIHQTQNFVVHLHKAKILETNYLQNEAASLKTNGVFRIMKAISRTKY